MGFSTSTCTEFVEVLEHKVTIKTLKNKEIASSNMVLKYGNDKYEDDYAFIYGDNEDKLLLNLSVDKYNNLDIEKRIPLYKNVYFCVGISAVAVLLLMLYLLNKNYKKYGISRKYCNVFHNCDCNYRVLGADGDFTQDIAFGHIFAFRVVCHSRNLFPDRI